MAMFHGDPMVRGVTEIIDRVVEPGIYNYWISLHLNEYKIFSRKNSYCSPAWWILQLQILSHATGFLPPFDGVVSKCTLLYGRDVL
jgi:hypothetical protein